MASETEITVEQWSRELCAALDLPASAGEHVTEILDVTRDAAHAVCRPAAPVAAFLVGLAAGRAGATPEAVAAACQIASDLARSHGADA